MLSGFDNCQIRRIKQLKHANAEQIKNTHTIYTLTLIASLSLYLPFYLCVNRVNKQKPVKWSFLSSGNNREIF